MGQYTVITFSPVQEFIEKSRKLRDLYGSSFIISYLAYFLTQAAEAQHIEVISPGLLDIARGTPNYLIFDGNFPKEDAEKAFLAAWGRIVIICREWLKEQFPNDNYSWNRHWNNWKNHAWEFFWGEGDTIIEAQQNLQDNKYQREWLGVNWEGDSSALSGADAIAFPDMVKSNPTVSDYKSLKKEINNYYLKLSLRVGEIYLNSKEELKRLKGEKREKKIKEYGEAIISPREPLSIPELIKRLITIDAVADRINDLSDLKPEKIEEAFEKTKIEKLDESFKELNRHEAQQWSGWFLGDGDRMGKYLRNLSSESSSQEEEKTKRKKFSQALMNWGKDILRPAIEIAQEQKPSIGRLIYAGGDDFMGVFSPKGTSEILTGKRCWKWWQDFRDLWNQHNYGDHITVSVGFVWAAPSVPQREILQNCHLAERMAKNTGRDRIAFRILFNSGNYLEWSCPWWFLPYLSKYKQTNWVNIYQDIAVLESRHSFTAQDTTVAKGLFAIYFGEENLSIFNSLWNDSEAGILGNEQNYQHPESGLLDTKKVNEALNNWVINLAKVGFHLFRNGDDQ